MVFKDLTKPDYKIQITILPYDREYKGLKKIWKRKTGSLTFSLYDTAPFNLESVEKAILKGMEVEGWESD